MPFEAPTPRQIQPIGFMKGRIQIPDDFDHMGKDEIKSMFDGDA